MSRPPCLAQATARSPSLPDAALAPAGIQQPSPAGAPRCLPITHERCRADSSRDGRELQETLMGTRLPGAFASHPWRSQRPPHRQTQQGAAPKIPQGKSLQLHRLGSVHPHVSATPPAWGHPSGRRLGTSFRKKVGDSLREGALSRSPTRQRMLHNPRPPSAISPQPQWGHCRGDNDAGTRALSRQAEPRGPEHPSGAGAVRAKPGACDRRGPDTCYNKYSAQTPFHMYDPVG